MTMFVIIVFKCHNHHQSPPDQALRFFHEIENIARQTLKQRPQRCRLLIDVSNITGVHTVPPKVTPVTNSDMTFSLLKPLQTAGIQFWVASSQALQAS